MKRKLHEFAARVHGWEEAIGACVVVELAKGDCPPPVLLIGAVLCVIVEAVRWTGGLD